MNISKREKSKRWVEAMQLARLASEDRPLLTFSVNWVPYLCRYIITWGDLKPHGLYKYTCEAKFRAGHELTD